MFYEDPKIQEMLYFSFYSDPGNPFPYHYIVLKRTPNSGKRTCFIDSNYSYILNSNHIKMMQKVEKDGLRTITLDDEQVDYMVSASTQALLEIPNH